MEFLATSAASSRRRIYTDCHRSRISLPLLARRRSILKHLVFVRLFLFHRPSPLIGFSAGFLQSRSEVRRIRSFICRMPHETEKGETFASSFAHQHHQLLIPSRLQTRCGYMYVCICGRAGATTPGVLSLSGKVARQ